MSAAQSTPTVDLQLDSLEGQLTRAQIQALIGELFRDDAGVTRVVVTPLPGSSAGMSSISLLLALPFSADGAQYNPVAVRIGGGAAITRERANYRSYVAPLTGVERAQLLDSRQARLPDADLEAISYSYMGQADQPIQTLREYLWRSAEPRRAILALRTLFAETLARDGEGRNGWQSDAQRFEAQQPAWFYNRVLPPILALEHVTLGGSPDSPAAIAAALAAADRPGARELVGRRLRLAPSEAYPRIELAEHELLAEGLARVRLHLLEGQPAGAEIYRPLAPLAGRVELRLAAADLPRLRAAIAAEETIGGVIADPRYAVLHQRVVAYQLRHSENIPGLDLAHAGRSLRDPLAHYADLLGAPMALHTSIIHGDLNLGNILIREHGYGSERTIAAWLIDFDQTGPGGHTVFDAVKLETEYKLHLLPHRLHGRDDFLRLETALHAGLVEPRAVDGLLGNDQNLIQAYEFIAALRRIALSPPAGARPHPAEYYLGLLGYGLAALKYRNLYDQGRARWLQRRARVEPLAVAAYLSATFAATVIEEVRGGGVVAESFPPPAGGQGARRPAEQLFASQRQIVEAAYQRLRGPDPRAAIIGPIGSDRELVASHIGYELEQAGYLLIAPLLYEPLSPHQSAALVVGDELVSSLGMLHRVQGLPSPLSSAPAPRGPGAWRIQIKAFVRQLAAALAADGRRFAITLPPRSGDLELQYLAEELAGALGAIPLLITSGVHPAYLPGEAQWELPTLDRADLRERATYARLSLTDDHIAAAIAWSGGLPLLIRQWLRQPDLVPGQADDRSRRQGGRQIFDQLDPPIQLMVGLAGMLDEGGYTLLESDLEQIARRMSAPHAPWDDAQGLRRALDAYRADLPVSLRELLYPLAHSWLQRQTARDPACAAAASYYAEQGSPYLAARYAAQVARWAEAEAQLRAFVQQPDLMYGISRERLADLAREVITSGEAHDAAALWLLAGDNEAFLGRYDAALHAYRQVADLTIPGDPRELRSLAQILTVHQARGDQEAADAAAHRLRRAAPSEHPAAVLPIAHEGIGQAQRGNPQTAEGPLRAALRALDPHAGAPEWAELHARLSDWLARALIMQGRYDEALTTLRLTRQVASQRLRDRALIAMIDNDLGIAYGRRGLPDDFQSAEAALSRSYSERKEIGDISGMLRSGQNLAINQVELARSTADWEAAERLYRDLLPLADGREDFDADQIYSNYLELLTRRGGAAQIDAVVARLKGRPDAGGFARARGVINVAQAWLWRDAPADCVRELNALAVDMADDADADQQIEWATLWLQLHLRHRVPYDPRVGPIGERAVVPDDRPLDTAKLLLLRGLLSAAGGASADADTSFQAARQQFAAIGFRYTAAAAALWQAEARYAGGLPAAEPAGRAIELLLPFGETPALARARALAADEGR